MVILSVCNVLIIPIIGKISEAIGGKNFFLLNLMIGAAVLLYFVRGLFSYGQTYLMSFAGQGIVRDLRVKIYRHVQDLSLDFFTKWRAGDVISRITGDIGVMQSATVSSVTNILPNLLTLIGVIGYLFYLNWHLTLLTILVFPIIAVIVSKFGKTMRDISARAQRKVADITSILQETITGARVVKSFAMEKHEVERFKKESDHSFWISIEAAVVHATQTPLLAFIQVLAVVTVIWFGGYEVVMGKLSPSNLIAFFAGVALLSDPIGGLSGINETVQASIAAAERVFEVIDIHPTVKEVENPIKMERLRGSVEFNNVTFKYEPNQEDVLKNIVVEVKPGEIIALVGPSGAGKSTFVNLIPRFYDPHKGSIIIDKTDVKLCELFSLRKQIGIVPQETLLFSGTVRDNIAYGKVDATDRGIKRVAKMANAHEFIMALPDKYDTLVGERGIRLSGGERQRVAVARALLRDPRILILDEATSSLDTESEKLVQDALEKLMVGRTTFVIAHRLSTVQFADRIIVIHQGRIIEEGPHRKLITKSGMYKKLYDMQFRYDEETANKT